MVGPARREGRGARPDHSGTGLVHGWIRGPSRRQRHPRERHGLPRGQGLEILDHNAVHEFRYEVVVGSLAQIRERAAKHAPTAPPSWTFANDRQGWHYRDAHDAGWPVSGMLDVSLDGPDPQLVGPLTLWEAESTPVLVIEAAFATGQKSATVYWRRLGTEGPESGDHLGFPVPDDGEFHRLVVRLDASPSYRGRSCNCASIRFRKEARGPGAGKIDCADERGAVFFLDGGRRFGRRYRGLPMKRAFVFFLLLTSLARPVAADHPVRTWTSTDGKTIEASLVQADRTSVILKLKKRPRGDRPGRTTQRVRPPPPRGSAQDRREPPHRNDARGIEDRRDRRDRGRSEDLHDSEFHLRLRAGSDQGLHQRGGPRLRGHPRGGAIAPLGLDPTAGAGGPLRRARFPLPRRATFEMEFNRVREGEGESSGGGTASATTRPGRGTSDVANVAASTYPPRKDSARTLHVARREHERQQGLPPQEHDTSTLIHEVTHQVMHDWLVATPLFGSGKASPNTSRRSRIRTDASSSKMPRPA